MLVVLKLGTGLATGSLALVSAGFESSGDVIAALLTLAAIRIAGRPADREHNYGHRRAENIAALGEAGIVFVGGCIIAFEAIRQLVQGGGDLHAAWYLFAVIGIALCIDITRIIISLRAAKRYEISGDHRFHDVAHFFWHQVAGPRAYATGGASNRENWLAPAGQLSAEWAAGQAHQECCCSYNMMKLTRQMYQWDPKPLYVDYYERNLLNQIGRAHV